MHTKFTHNMGSIKMNSKTIAVTNTTASKGLK
jgi:hypothetical protein